MKQLLDFSKPRLARCRHPLFILAATLLLSAAPCKPQEIARAPVTTAQIATPEPAIPAVLNALKTFEVVGMPAAHGEKDVDDFILSLLRDPRLPGLVDDIVVECGNQRYQPILDRYIAGDAVPFTDVQHVWRDTTVLQMCGTSSFYEQLFPLVRSINQQLPATHRFRVVAADPPIDWSRIHTAEDLTPFFDRDGSIAAVMEREVLSRHRKALMLFGVFHLLHGGGPGQGDAVTRYERDYPGRTFVISDLGYYNVADATPREAQAPVWAWPALLKTKGSRLGALGLSSFLPSPITTDQDCTVRDAFGESPSHPVAEQVDAFLYLGPQETLLSEPFPADIALDRVYRAEWLRRLQIVGFPVPSTLEELDAQIVAGAAHPFLTMPKGPVPEALRARMRQSCLDSRHAAAPPAP